MSGPGWHGAWSRFRYDRLLPGAARSRAAGRHYARLVGRVEFAADRTRRRTAEARLTRWLGVSPSSAAGLFRRSLVSEAREEADSAYFMRHPDALLRWFPDRVEMPRVAGPTVFATLHLRHPVLAYAFLRRARGLDVRVVIRGLDDANPMADPKRRWGERKIAWLRELVGVDFLGTDTGSIARAREHLVAGGSLFAAIDVPGEVVARASVVEVCGERLALSAGVIALARMTRSRVLPMIALGHPERMGVHFGGAVEAGPASDPMGAVFHELEGFIRRFPDEWWLWPYVGDAPRG